MTTAEPDETAFGDGGGSSHDADVAGAYQWVVDPAGEGGADGGVENSHDADMLGAFDDPGKVTHDGTGLHH